MFFLESDSCYASVAENSVTFASLTLEWQEYTTDNWLVISILILK